jgi:hypothetical protein
MYFFSKIRPPPRDMFAHLGHPPHMHSDVSTNPCMSSPSLCSVPILCEFEHHRIIGNHRLLDIDDRAQYLQPWETKLKLEQERLETVQRALAAEQQRLAQAHDNLRAQQETMHAKRLEQDAAADVRTLELRQQQDDLNRKEVEVESEVRRIAQQNQRLEERMAAEHERARTMDQALSARHLAIEAREHELGDVQRQLDTMKSQLEQQRISLVRQRRRRRVHTCVCVYIYIYIYIYLSCCVCCLSLDC